jgi:DNA-binding transcriptional ArsR family regulator
MLVMCADVQAMPPTDEQVEQAVGTLAMLADPTRIRLLWALLDGELPVHDLASTVGCSATSASQHLAKLRLAGLVRHRRDGRRVLYSTEDTHVRRLLQEALYHADHAVQGHPAHA